MSRKIVLPVLVLTAAVAIALLPHGTSELQLHAFKPPQQGTNATLRAETKPSFHVPKDTQIQNQLEEADEKLAFNLVQNANLADGNDLRTRLSGLERLPRTQLANSVFKFYKKTGSAEPRFREKLLWFSKELSDLAFVPLWKDVLLRKTMRTPSENELPKVEIDDEHFAFDSYARQQEQLTALDELQRWKDLAPDAHVTLKEIALGKLVLPGRGGFLRERAAWILVQDSPNEAQTLLSQLATTDPLQKSLRERLKFAGELK